MNRKVMATIAIGFLALATMGAGPAPQAYTMTFINTVSIKASPERVWKYINEEQISVDPATGKIKMAIFPEYEIANMTGEGPGTTYDWTLKVLGQTYTGAGVIAEIVPNALAREVYAGDASLAITDIYQPHEGGTRLTFVWDFSSFAPKGPMTREAFIKEFNRMMNDALKTVKEQCEKK